MLGINAVVKLRRPAADKLPEDWKAKVFSSNLVGRIVMIDVRGYHLAFGDDEEDLVLCGHRDMET